jgi:uncharacterized protein (DUF433 family)
MRMDRIDTWLGRAYLVEKEGQAMQTYRQFITSDPNVLFGKPAIRGTRIAVELILDELAGGTTIEQLLEEYPRLTREAVYAALAFAADTLRSEVVYPLDIAS